MTQRVFVATFKRDEDIVKAAAAVRERGLAIADCYTPYAVHGLDAAMGLPPSRLPIACFGLGLLGAASIMAFQYWASAIDWAINVGGRPLNSWPAFVPATFEMMVLFAAIGTVLAFIVVSGLRPWRTAVVPDPRVTDDHFALVLVADGRLDRAQVETMLTPFHLAGFDERDMVAAGASGGTTSGRATGPSGGAAGGTTSGRPR